MYMQGEVKNCVGSAFLCLKTSRQDIVDGIERMLGGCIIGDSVVHIIRDYILKGFEGHCKNILHFTLRNEESLWGFKQRNCTIKQTFTGLFGLQCCEQAGSRKQGW